MSFIQCSRAEHLLCWLAVGPGSLDPNLLGGVGPEGVSAAWLEGLKTTSNSNLGSVHYSFSDKNGSMDVSWTEEESSWTLLMQVIGATHNKDHSLADHHKYTQTWANNPIPLITFYFKYFLMIWTYAGTYWFQWSQNHGQNPWTGQ